MRDPRHQKNKIAETSTSAEQTAKNHRQPVRDVPSAASTTSRNSSGGGNSAPVILVMLPVRRSDHRSA
ncbi:MAG: hypothetical protein NUV77_10170, partial [Thermoguttaceae bacterium]|nr:hypothetical protein [Thermoguttaceae bacterium]